MEKNKIKNFENYAFGRWVKGDGDGTSLYNAINEEKIGVVSSEGLDFSKMMNYARGKGSEVLRKMT